MDFYAANTPNGQKVAIALEEMDLPHRLVKVDLQAGDQHKPEYLKLNPNGKMPTIVDEGRAIFESVAILIYLAEKTGRFLAKSGPDRSTALEWCLFQAAHVGPMFGQFGHFAVHAKEKVPYAIERYHNESLRLLGVLDGRLANNHYLAGAE